MAYGCVLPFMPLIWRSKGLSGEKYLDLLTDLVFTLVHAQR